MHPIIKEVRKIARKYGVTVRFKRLKKDVSGFSYYDEDQVVLSAGTYCRSRVLSTMFHELGHIECYRKGIWKRYHDAPEKMDGAVRAEKWCDRWAACALRGYDPQVKYMAAYANSSNEENRKFLQKFHADSEKEERSLLGEPAVNTPILRA